MKYIFYILILAAALFFILQPKLIHYEAPHYTPRITKTKFGTLSWYSPKEGECMGCSESKITACGVQMLDTSEIIAANWLPCHTRVLIQYGSKAVTAWSEDRCGCERHGRIADAAKTVFEKLAPTQEGLINVSITAL